MSWKLGAVVVSAAVAAAVVVLTRPGNGKTAYVDRNEALLASLPVFPGAVKVRQARVLTGTAGPLVMGRLSTIRCRRGRVRWPSRVSMRPG